MPNKLAKNYYKLHCCNYKIASSLASFPSLIFIIFTNYNSKLQLGQNTLAYIATAYIYSCSLLQFLDTNNIAKDAQLIKVLEVIKSYFYCSLYSYIQGIISFKELIRKLKRINNRKQRAIAQIAILKAIDLYISCALLKVTILANQINKDLIQKCNRNISLKNRYLDAYNAFIAS